MARGVLALTLVAVAAGGSIASAVAMSTGTPSLSTVSNLGITVTVTPTAAQEQMIGHSPVAGGLVRLLARRNGVSVYWIGGNCLGVGASPSLVGSMACGEQSFPSPQKPIFDGTSLVGHLPPGQTTWQWSFGHVAGIATDGVASIELRTASGGLIARAPVIANVYVFDKNALSSVFTTGPPTLVALDHAGNTVYSRQFHLPHLRPGLP
jgi:hypothetical protein